MARAAPLRRVLGGWDVPRQRVRPDGGGGSCDLRRHRVGRGVVGDRDPVVRPLHRRALGSSARAPFPYLPTFFLSSRRA